MVIDKMNVFEAIHLALWLYGDPHKAARYTGLQSVDYNPRVLIQITTEMPILLSISFTHILETEK